jgi:2-methylisocitrate lyase-like PEP mutase family enzyme
VLSALGFKALATTSSGFAASLGRFDGQVSRGEAIAHAAAITQATGLPVNADLENGYADTPTGVAETIRLAAAAGLHGCSVEDWSGNSTYELDLATERVTAAAEAAHSAPEPIVLTARAENHIRDRHDVTDTITRLQHYQEAGADVLYAPGLASIQDIHAVLKSIDRPLNVLAVPGLPGLTELAATGVSRISVGGVFAYHAYGALIQAATELRDTGTYGFLHQPAAAYRELAATFDQ